jgi:hypothetical protein
MRDEDFCHTVFGAFGLDKRTGRAALPLLYSLVGSVPERHRKNSSEVMNHVLALLHEIQPKDGMEGMLAAQMISTHSLAIDSMRKASSPEQTTFGVTECINRAHKLMKLFAGHMEALRDYHAILHRDPTTRA